MRVKFLSVTVLCFLQICLCSAYAQTADNRPKALTVFRQSTQILKDAEKVVGELTSCARKGVGASNAQISSISYNLLPVLNNVSARITSAVGAMQQAEQVISQVEHAVNLVKDFEKQIAQYKKDVESAKDKSNDVSLKDKLNEEKQKVKEQETEDFNKLSPEEQQKLLENYSASVKEISGAQDTPSDLLSINDVTVSIPQKNDTPKDTAEEKKAEQEANPSVAVPQVSISDSGEQQINNLEEFLKGQ